LGGSLKYNGRTKRRSSWLFVSQNDDGEEIAEQELVEQDPIEEIRVIEKPLRSLSTELYKKKKLVFSLFNELNDDSDYDVRCRLEYNRKRSGASKKCTTRYYRKEMQRATRIARFSGYINDYRYEVDRVALNEKYGMFNLKMREMIDTNQEFHKAMSDYVIAKRSYEDARAKDMRGNFFTIN
jgi:hypothetical protein